MKKSKLFKLALLSLAVVAFSSCISKKKKKCNTCPDWGGIEVKK